MLTAIAAPRWRNLKWHFTVLGRWFITKYGTKRGIIVIGRLAPFGIGPGIGGAGNALFGKTVVSGAKRAFGPPPQRWDEEDEPEPVPSSRSDQEHEDAGNSWAGAPRAQDEGRDGIGC